MKRVAVSWSSGKDSAWMLHVLRSARDIEVVALITTFNRAFDRVAMHAVRRQLVEAQAVRTGVPLWAVDLPRPCPNIVYEQLMAGVCRRAVDENIQAIAFGDLFLRDIREYRERQLQGTGLEPVFPLWEVPTRELAMTMIRSGLKAKLTCIDPGKLDRAYAGREFEPALLSSLPPAVDACGENGEFHTFVYGGPMFSHEIDIQIGEIIERDGFVFADVFEPAAPRDTGLVA